MRLKAVTSRVARYRRLGKVAASRLVRTGAAPALRFGVGVCGAPDSAIRAARRFACAVRGEMRGRSAFARLQLGSYDVGAQMAVDPIVEWCRAAWDHLVSDEDLQVTWRAAIAEVNMSTRPFAAVRGPAGAMIASALRIGWAVPGQFSFLTRDKTLIDIQLT